jgi:hypothetical protein
MIHLPPTRKVSGKNPKSLELKPFASISGNRQKLPSKIRARTRARCPPLLLRLLHFILFVLPFVRHVLGKRRTSHVRVDGGGKKPAEIPRQNCLLSLLPTGATGSLLLSLTLSLSLSLSLFLLRAFTCARSTTNSQEVPSRSGASNPPIWPRPSLRRHRQQPPLPPLPPLPPPPPPPAMSRRPSPPSRWPMYVHTEAQPTRTRARSYPQTHGGGEREREMWMDTCIEPHTEAQGQTQIQRGALAGIGQGREGAWRAGAAAIRRR